CYIGILLVIFLNIGYSFFPRCSYSRCQGELRCGTVQENSERRQRCGRRVQVVRRRETDAETEEIPETGSRSRRGRRETGCWLGGWWRERAETGEEQSSPRGSESS